MDRTLARRLFAELLGSAFLAAVVIGSGIAAQRLSPGDIGLELFENAAATAAGLYAIILMFGPVSGGTSTPSSHSSTPASAASAGATRSPTFPPRSSAASSVLSPPTACSRCRSSASRPSTAPAARTCSQRVIATLGLLLVIFSLARTREARRRPLPSGPTLAPPTSSRAPPASPTRRSASGACSPTRSPGSHPPRFPAYIVAQLIGGVVAIATIRALYPHVTPEQAADVVLPHGERRPT